MSRSLDRRRFLAAPAPMPAGCKPGGTRGMRVPPGAARGAGQGLDLVTGHAMAPETAAGSRHEEVQR